MNRLSQEEQQLILDFYFRCGEQKEIEAGRDLIACNPGAAELYARLEDTLTQLDNVKYEPCPDNLVDLTIARLKLAAIATKSQEDSTLVHLLTQQQHYTAPQTAETDRSRFRLMRTNLLRPAVETLAAAAAILIVAGMLFPSFGKMRQHSRQMACSSNLSQAGTAFTNFFNDHNGNSPEMKIKEGSPWWKIGDNGLENQSNTRYVWQLVKQGYVPANAFICTGRNGAAPVQVTREQMAGLQDFPSRDHVSYSFILFSNTPISPSRQSRRVLAGDLNPVFEKIPCRQSIYQKLNEFEKVMLNEQLRQAMSGNHGCRGQNILFTDGSVQFVNTRMIAGDDIFTVKGVDAYTGCEKPADTQDVFLVP